jgi:bacterioferritin-associated ferredoxin
MYVCLCVGATNQTVSDAVASGASTSRDCGRCRRTLRAIIAASKQSEPELDAVPAR